MGTVRYACLEDLNNYFKKKDLLSGLTELEKSKLRYNIGVPNSINENQTISIEYNSLYELILRNELISGTRYIITDFQSIYSSNVNNINNQKITWGNAESENPSKIWSIVVIAITNSTLDKNIIILREESKNWIAKYDITRETLPDGVMTKGKITYLKDENGNSAFYDFKNIKFRRTKSELENSNFTITSPYIDLYTFSSIQNVILDNSNSNLVKYNEIKEGCWNNIFIGDTYNNIIFQNCINNTFIRGIHDSTLKWNSTNNLFNENISYVEGSIYNKRIEIGNTLLSSSITKNISKYNELTLISYIDPILNTYKIIQW